MTKIQMEVNASDSEFITQFFRVLTFPSNKPIASSFLVNNLYFITHIAHRGQGTDRLQPVKEPPQKYCPFLLLNISLLIRDRNVSLVKVYWRYTEFQFVFPSKSRWNYIFQATNCRRIILIFSLLEEQQ